MMITLDTIASTNYNDTQPHQDFISLRESSKKLNETLQIEYHERKLRDSRIEEFNKKVAERIDKGASDFVNKLEYQKKFRHYIDIVYFYDNPDRRFLFITFHLKPCRRVTAEKTLRHFLNCVNRLVFKSQHRNHNIYLATIPVIEGSTRGSDHHYHSAHYHVLIENLEGTVVSDAIRSVWAKHRRRWCFLDDNIDIRECYDREGVLNYILKFRTKDDIRDSIDFMNLRVPYAVQALLNELPRRG